MMTRSVIVGCGAYLPERIVTNDELAQKIDTSDDWIRERSGITQRHIAADGQLTSDLALRAARQALEKAGVAAQDLDLLIVATSTPDQTFPSTATKVQGLLGMTGGAAFDIQAVCSGFIFALTTADKFIRSGAAKTALVIGAETFSRILDWEDRNTCVLFGDGAGAVVLKASEEQDSAAARGILSTHLHSDGRYTDMLYVDGGPSSSKQVGHLKMEGKEVFRHAVVNLAKVVQEALAVNHLTSADVDWVVPHQANRRIIEGTAKKLNFSLDQMVMTVDRHANTSAASVPLALTEAINDGRIKPGQMVLLEAMGGGFTWGAVLVRL